MYETERLMEELLNQNIDIRNIVVNNVLYPGKATTANTRGRLRAMPVEKENAAEVSEPDPRAVRRLPHHDSPTVRARDEGASELSKLR